jgi:hypothetical protein
MTFRIGDKVTVCNDRDRWFSMSIHGTTETFTVRDWRYSSCPGCAGHDQHLLLTIQGEDAWVSGMWFDPEYVFGTYTHTKECRDYQEMQEKDYWDDLDYLDYEEEV